MNSEERTIGQILQKVEDLDKKLDTFVTQDQFWPVKTIVYGLVGIIMISVVGTLVYSVISKTSREQSNLSVKNTRNI
jgi:hypothetical protein